MQEPEEILQEFNTLIAEKSMQQDLDEYFDDPWQATYDAMITTVVNISHMYMAMRQLENYLKADKAEREATDNE